MRLSTSYYPEQIDYTCIECQGDNTDVTVDSIEDESVIVICPQCGEIQYERIIE